MGYAGSYFCFPISLTDAEILGIWVSLSSSGPGLVPELGPTAGVLEWTQCNSTRRVSQVSLKARGGEIGATRALC